MLFGFTQINAQDIHFSYYEFAPLTINPALTGNFLGSYRISGIYRDQWASVKGGRQYSTPNLAVDLPAIRGFRKQDWLGVGVNVFRDASFGFNLTTFRSSQSIAYHLALDKKQTSVISIGVQQIVGRRQLNRNANIITEGSINANDPSFQDTDVNLIKTDNTKINDWSAGVTFHTFMNKTNYLQIGFAVDRIRRANQGLLTTGVDNQKLEYKVFALYDTPLSSKLFLRPQALYQRTGNNQELVLQSKVSYLFDAAKDLYLNAGLGYRVGDAVQVLLGADYKDWKFGISYDMNANRFIPATNTFGALELAVTYVGKVYKKPKVDPTMVCPRL